MKRFISLFLAMVITMSLCFGAVGVTEASAASNIAGGTCGASLDWWLTTDGVLYIEGTGEMNYWDWYDDLPWHNQLSQIKQVVIKSGVTEVGAHAFNSASNLTKVSLPSTVKKIEGSAFANCKMLASINIPSDVTSIGGNAFNGCISLKSVTFPSKLTNIGMSAFEGSGLTSVTLPASLTTLDAYVFQNCDSLKTATIGVGKGSFTIGKWAFAQCDNLTTVKMGDAVNYVHYYAFEYCPKLADLTIGKNVGGLGGSSFGYCTSLTSVRIPDSVVNLDRDNWGYGPFRDCTNLSQVVFGSGVEWIQAKSFSGCTKLETIYFLGDAPAFEGTETFKDCTIEAYYPSGNTTWKQKHFTNHGGSIEWNSFNPFIMEQPTLKVTNKVATGKPYLSWSKVDGADKYEVYRSTSGKAGTFYKMWTGTKLNVTHTGAAAGTTYYYKVRAVDGGDKTMFSGVVSRACDIAQPTITVATVASSGKPKVTWSKVTGADKYEVYRSKNGKNGTYTLAFTTTGTSYTNSGATPGYAYYYKVRAIDADKSSANSAFSTIKGVYCDCARPVTTISLNGGKPRIKWSKVTGASKYKVYRSTSLNGTYSLISTTTYTSLTNTSAKAGVTYYYKVRAISSKTSSADSVLSTAKSIKSK